MTTAVGSTANTPSASSSKGTTNLAGSTLDKDDFVRLLVAQMTHQDPLNPADSSQMAAQMAQFSSVEQLMNISSKMDTQSSSSTYMLDALDRNAALGMIGREVTAVSDEITVSGHAAAPVQVDVPSAGAKVRVRIVDAAGKELSSQDLGVLSSGRQTLDLSKSLKGVPNGSYTIKVESIDSKGTATAMSPIQTFTIDGLRFGTNGAVLTSGNRSVPIAYVIGVASK